MQYRSETSQLRDREEEDNEVDLLELQSNFLRRVPGAPQLPPSGSRLESEKGDDSDNPDEGMSPGTPVTAHTRSKTKNSQGPQWQLQSNIKEEDLVGDKAEAEVEVEIGEVAQINPKGSQGQISVLTVRKKGIGNASAQVYQTLHRKLLLAAVNNSE